MDKELQAQLEASIKEANFTDAIYTKVLDEDTGEEIKVFVVSDESVDREGEVISIDGWKLDNFKRNPVMLWSHNPFDPPIGKWKNIKFRTINGKKKLTMEPDFHRKSNMSALIAELVENGYPPQTTSVGFRAIEMEGNKFTKQELLEVSFVNIPANPEATSLALTRGYPEEIVGKLFTIVEEKQEEKSEKQQSNRDMTEIMEQMKQLREIINQQNEQIQNLQVGIDELKAAKKHASRHVAGRVDGKSAETKRLLQIANKALDKALQGYKQNG